MKYHDRLDLKLESLEYQDKECGSMSWTEHSQWEHGSEQKPTYCCSECPTLMEKFKDGHPGPYRLVS